MKISLLLTAFTLFAVSACASRTYEATAILPENVTVTYSVRSMFGFHSDWTRQVRIANDGEEIQQELFEDTGWWRGSHLYRHASGIYVIHEGQAGCFGFTVEPLSFNVLARISCEKREGIPQDADGASQYYADLVYLGAFIETPNSTDGSPISFLSADERPEAELPDIL